MGWSALRRLLLQLLLVLVGLEGVAQVATRLGSGRWFAQKAEEAYPAFYEASPGVRWRLRANLDIMHNADDFRVRVQTNADRFRDRPEPMRPGGLLFAGDSFTFGWGVEVGQRFSSLIEGELAKDPATRGIPVYNIGTPGWGIAPETLLLDEVVARARPRAVVLETWLFDWDILDTANLACFGTHLFSRQATETDPRLLQARIFAVNHLCMADLAQKLPALVAFARRSRALQSGHVPRELLYGGFGLDAFLAAPYPEPIAAAEQQWLACMTHITELTSRQGIPLLVTMVPSAFQLDPAKLEQVKQIYGMSGPLDLAKPHRLAAAHLDTLRVPHLDLLPVITEAARSSKAPLYFDHDVHWTAAGHVVAAHAILGRLRSLHLLDSAVRSRP